MSCSSLGHRGRWNRRVMKWQPRRALTTVELLVALLFVLAVIGGAVVAFVALQRHAEETKAKLIAMAEARHALISLSTDLAQAQLGPASMVPKDYFFGSNEVQPTGNRKDDDGDGQTDEEVFDGKDDDGDWQASDDRHVEIAPGLFERPQGRNQADFGDSKVDEDTKFTRASLLFRIPSETTGSITEVRYRLGTFDDVPNVLIRETVTSSGTEAGPIAFNILSFSALFWDSNAPPGPTREWVNSWDSTTLTGPGNVPLPVSVLLEVTVYAGRRPYSELGPNDPIETVRLTTVVNVESALNHPNYQRNPVP